MRLKILPIIVSALLTSTRISNGDEVRNEFYALSKWRDGEFVYANAAYLISQFFSGTASYHDCLMKTVLKDSPCLNLADFQDSLEELNLNARIIKCNLEQLASLPRPVFVHFDGPSGQSGSLALLISRKLDKPLIVDCSLCRIDKMELETFTRKWSGYCVLVSPPNKNWQKITAASAGMIVTLIITLLLSAKKSQGMIHE
jgi:ABC-type bacteriocin/lantibiotic exporter with double-glycine peptidase domain